MRTCVPEGFYTYFPIFNLPRVVMALFRWFQRNHVETPNDEDAKDHSSLLQLVITVFLFSVFLFVCVGQNDCY